MYIYVHRPSTHVFSIPNRFGIPGRYLTFVQVGIVPKGTHVQAVPDSTVSWWKDVEVEFHDFQFLSIPTLW